MNILNIKEYFNKEMEKLRRAGNECPSLLIIDPTEGDPANQIYIRKKKEDFDKLGWECDVVKVTTTDELRLALEKNVFDYSGIIVQMPQAPGIDFNPSWIPPHKDADGLSPLSIVTPATVRGIIDYLDTCGFEYAGKSAVVIGRSQIVGRPMAKALIDKDMTASVVHSKTPEEVRDRLLYNADLVVVAAGHPHLIRRSQCPFAFVVDVGINRQPDGKLVGDFLEEEITIAVDVPCRVTSLLGKSAALSTPVPGGVGLLTRLGLLKNCVELCQLENQVQK